MTRLVWLTDLHLNFAPEERTDALCQQVREQKPGVVLLTGDISESDQVEHYLTILDEQLTCPLYFVLGNHDFCYSSIHAMRQRVRRLCARREKLHYLTDSELTPAKPVALTRSVGLIGHDGWADARLGDYQRSMVMLNDYRLIEELSGMSKSDRLLKLHALGDEAAASIARVLPLALEKFDHTYLLTHVPPFREACWHEGRTSDDEWAPHFTCHALGQKLLEIMQAWPQSQLTVLCGHTHGYGRARLLDNLVVQTGGATYGEPEVQSVIDLPGQCLL